MLLGDPMVEDNKATGLMAALESQWDALSGAPIPYAVALLAVALLIWKGTGWLYRHQIGNLNSTIKLKDTQIELVEAQLRMERESVPLTPPPGAEPDAPRPAISLDPDVVRVYQGTQAEPITLTVNPLEPSEGWGKTLSTDELNDVAAVRNLHRHGLVSVEKTGETSYTATATATGMHPEIVEQINKAFEDAPVKKLRLDPKVGPKPKLKLGNVSSQGPDEEDEDEQG